MICWSVLEPANGFVTLNPELMIETDKLSVEESAQTIIAYLLEKE